MNSRRAHQRLLLVAVATAITLIPGPSGIALADDGPWSVRLGISYIDVGGHDPHVLDVSGSSHSLETQSGFGPQFGLRHEGGKKWNWGADFKWFTGAQDLSVPDASGTAGATATYAITERAFTSTSPDDVLFFSRLGDTDMNAWTFDLYALRRLSGDREGGWRLMLGLRNADFDNDNRFAAGIENVGGSRIDASSNYSRMIGPLLGLVWNRRSGKHDFEIQLSLSAVSADAELAATLSDFVGPFDPNSMEFVAQQQFSKPDSVTIPIGDLGARWNYAVSDWLTLGLGLDVSRWNDVSVPPGVSPSGTLETLSETSITFSSLTGNIGIRF